MADFEDIDGDSLTTNDDDDGGNDDGGDVGNDDDVHYRSKQAQRSREWARSKSGRQ